MGKSYTLSEKLEFMDLIESKAREIQRKEGLKNPSINKACKAINDDPELPNVSRSTYNKFKKQRDEEGTFENLDGRTNPINHHEMERFLEQYAILHINASMYEIHKVYNEILVPVWNGVYEELFKTYLIVNDEAKPVLYGQVRRHLIEQGLASEKVKLNTFEDEEDSYTISTLHRGRIAKGVIHEKIKKILPHLIKQGYDIEDWTTPASQVHLDESFYGKSIFEGKTVEELIERVLDKAKQTPEQIKNHNDMWTRWIEDFR